MRIFAKTNNNYLINKSIFSEYIFTLKECDVTRTRIGPGLEVIKLEYKLRLKIKLIDWLLADTCPQTANHCALF